MYLIAGVDPGTTTGVALLDLKGNLVDVESRKEMGLGSLIEYLVSKGRVSMVAVDVSPAPQSIEKLSTQLGASLHVPDESLSSDEKIDSTREFDTDDAHQRDALAAALYSFHRNQNKLRKIDSLDLDKETKKEAKNLVLRGMSLDKALDFIEEKRRLRRKRRQEKKQTPQRPEPGKSKDKSSFLRKRITRLERENSLLEDALSSKKNECKRLSKKLDRLKRRRKDKYDKERWRDEEIRERERYIGGLEYKMMELRKRIHSLEKVQEAARLILGGYVEPVGIWPQVYNGLTLMRRKPKKHELNDLGDEIEIAFVDEPEEYDYLRDKGVPIASSEKVVELEGLAYIEEDDLREVHVKEPIVSLEEIVGDYRSERNLR